MSGTQQKEKKTVWAEQSIVRGSGVGLNPKLPVLLHEGN